MQGLNPGPLPYRGGGAASEASTGSLAPPWTAARTYAAGKSLRSGSGMANRRVRLANQITAAVGAQPERSQRWLAQRSRIRRKRCPCGPHIAFGSRRLADDVTPPRITDHPTAGRKGRREPSCDLRVRTMPRVRGEPQASHGTSGAAAECYGLSRPPSTRIRRCAYSLPASVSSEARQTQLVEAQPWVPARRRLSPQRQRADRCPMLAAPR